MEKKANIISGLSDRIVELGLIMIVTGLFFSNALKSIGLVTVCASIFIHPSSFSNIKRLLRTKLYWVLLVLAGGYLVSFINSDDLGEYWKLSRLKWAFFAFPLAFVNCSWSRHFLNVLFIMALCFGITQAGYSLYDYYTKNGLEIARMYSTGNFLETYKTGAHQVSILLSVIILLLYDRLFRHVNDHTAVRLLLGCTCLFFFLMVHLYAVRAGIILTYVFILGYSIYGFRAESRKIIVVLAVTATLGGVLLMSLETVKHRIGYLKYDIEQYIDKKSGASLYSDSRRLTSLQIGIKVIEQYPWLGSGLGDLQKNCAEIYRASYPDLEEQFYYLPHGQFIYILAAFGLLIGIPMCISFFFPAFIFLKMRMPVYFLFGMGWVLFALWDTPLGTLFGNCLFLLFISFGIRKMVS